MGWLAIALALAPWLPRAAPPDRCDVVAVTPMVFTGYSPFGPGVAATFTITYTCPPSITSAWIGISSPRGLRAGSDTLQFELYQGADRAAVWPESPPVPVPVSASGTVTVYGFLPPQDAAAGMYGEHPNLSVEIHGGDIRRRDATASVTVVADVLATCLISPATLAFGSYDPLAATALDAQGTIQIACTRNTSYAVGLGPGSHAAGTRQMANGAARLPYELYTDAGRTTIWTTTATVGGSAPSTASIPLTVHGRIPAGQAVAAGGYADTVQSTINF